MEQGHFKPGDRCDRYAVVRLLGAGGMGEVYEAVHAFTGRPVALKCLQLRHASKADILERMRREAIFLSQFRHPNMVEVHDADITPEGIVWIAMELLEGKTLRELLHAAGPLPVQVITGSFDPPTNPTPSICKVKLAPSERLATVIGAVVWLGVVLP